MLLSPPPPRVIRVRSPPAYEHSELKKKKNKIPSPNFYGKDHSWNFRYSVFVCVLCLKICSCCCIANGITFNALPTNLNIDFVSWLFCHCFPSIIFAKARKCVRTETQLKPMPMPLSQFDTFHGNAVGRNTFHKHRQTDQMFKLRCEHVKLFRKLTI